MLREPLVARGGVTKYIIVRATCGSDRSLEVRVVESEFICRTLHVFTVARHTELSKHDIYLFVCLFWCTSQPQFSSCCPHCPHCCLHCPCHGHPCCHSLSFSLLLSFSCSGGGRVQTCECQQYNRFYRILFHIWVSISVYLVWLWVWWVQVWYAKS